MEKKEVTVLEKEEKAVSEVRSNAARKGVTLGGVLSGGTRRGWKGESP
jgi:hypothetical protein